jgi:hypothetical protein
MLSKLRTLLVCTIALIALTPRATAQVFPTAAVIPVSGSPIALGTADFNRDGHADIVYQDMYTGGNLHVLLGKGDGTFTPGQTIPLPQGVGANITVGDLNGDGIPDLILGYDFSYNAQVNDSITVLLGHGDGTFSSPAYFAVSNAEVSFYGKMGIADFDGDGHADVIASDFDGSLYFFKGDGQGHLATPVIVSGPIFGTDVLVADLNGDGRPDFVVASSYSFDVFINPGNAVFSTPVSYPTNFYSSGQNSLLLADVNGDGHPDLLYGDFSEQLWAAYGRSDGTFAPSVVIATPPTHDPAVLAVSDLNGDHKPRVLLSSDDGVAVTLGATPNGSLLYAATGNLFDFAVAADFNGDGLMDVAVPGDKSLVILFGKPDGTFEAAPSVETNSPIGGITLLDDTGDGIPDVILSQNAVYPGKGDGTFGPEIGQGSGQPGFLYSGDFDGNGHLGFFAYFSIYHNDGDGTFTPQYLPTLNSGGFPTYYAAIADFNLDGHADVAISASGGSSGNSVAVATSASDGTYTDTEIPFPEFVGPLGAGDFDGDSCPDLAVGAATQIEIFLGDCKGGFKPGATYLTNTGATTSSINTGFQSSLEPSDIAVADFDGDGHLDIVYTVPGLSLAKILYGVGDGTFIPGNDLTLPHSSIFVTSADFDSDGNTDLIFSGENLATIYYGNHTRAFGNPSVLAAGFATGKAVVSDLNRDGNPDIVIPNLDFDGGDDSNDSGVTFTVFLNQLPARNSRALNPSVVVSPEPSAFGQPFTATATFKPSTGAVMPTGTVTFTLDGATPLTATLSNSGSANATYPMASVGDHIVAAKFPGDTNFNSASASVKHVVNGNATTTTLTSSLNPSTYGQPVTFTAHISSSTGIPTGSVAFTDSQAALGTVAVDAGGNASFTTSTLSANDLGTSAFHSIAANYVPTGGFTASGALLQQVVNGLPSSTVLTITPTSGPASTTFTLTAKVASASSSSTITPTGTVVFYTSAQTGITGNELGYAVLVNGVATFTSTGLLKGTDYIVGIYLGDGIYAGSTSNYFILTVNTLPTTTTIAISPNPSIYGQLVVFSAHVAPTTAAKLVPTGPVVLTCGATIITLPPIDASGNASTTAQIPQPVGSCVFTGQYPGDTNFDPSTSAAVTYQVKQAPTTTVVSASPATAYVSQPVKFTVQITGITSPSIPVTGPPIPPGPLQFAGTVQLFDGTSPIGAATPVTVSSPSTAQTAITINTLAPGSHTITATYTNDPNLGDSTSPPITEVILIIPPADFTLTGPPSITFRTESTGTGLLLLGSVNGFAGPVALTCNPPLPYNYLCTLSRTTATVPANGGASSTITLQPNLRSSTTTPATKPPISTAMPRILLAALLPLALLTSARRKRRRLSAVVSLAIVTMVTINLSACGPDIFYAATPPGTYPITVTATGTAQGTAAPISHTLPINIVITP